MRASVEGGLREVAIPFMQDLYETRETVHLGLREGVEVVDVEKTGCHWQASSPSLARAGRLKVPTTAAGAQGLIAMPGFDEIEIVRRNVGQRAPRKRRGSGAARQTAD